jgi:hypothetical protein
MKLLFMQLYLSSCYFVSLSYKYSPEHPVLSYLQSMFFT